MNILIPEVWLREFLKTKAGLEKIADCLSLSSASVEKIDKVDGQKVMDIEITTNRPDMMSVFGIAREALAVLPQFGIEADLFKDPYAAMTEDRRPKTEIEDLTSLRLRGAGRRQKNGEKLKIEIRDKGLCERFSAVVLKNIKIKPSPKKIQKKLKLAGQRPINNLVDITNILMKSYGQPVHVFDWNQIKKKKMILRKSKKGEKITTLDGKTHKLPGRDIVIEDGSGRLIDLCGIMGGANSHVGQKTTSVLLFVQNYNPKHIRKTTMKLGKRTEASALFEKDPDTELVMPTLNKGIELYKKWAEAKVCSKIYDVYPIPYKPKKVKVSLQLIKQYLGVSLQLNEVIKILNSLGIESKKIKSGVVESIVPSWRSGDIEIQQDLIEEIARIYGYHNLPSVFAPIKEIPKKPKGGIFYWKNKVKGILKDFSFTETYTYSMQSKVEIEDFGLVEEKHLKIKNPLSKEWVYMRTNLLPSLLTVMNENLSEQRANICLFEISKVYLKRKGKLPKEKNKLAIMLRGNNFFELKGIVKALLGELQIEINFQPQGVEKEQWIKSKTAKIGQMGQMGQISPEVLRKWKIAEPIMAVYLDFDKMCKRASKKKKYTPICKYPPVIEDFSFILKKGVYFNQLKELVKKISPLIKQVELIDKYKNSLTLRIYFQHKQKNLSLDEVDKIRKKIIVKVKEKGLGKLRERK